MSAAERLFGPVLSQVGLEIAYDDDKFADRMAYVRQMIFEIRSQWADSAYYNDLKAKVRNVVQGERHSALFLKRLEQLLTGYCDYADIDISRAENRAVENYNALEIYCSEEGYECLYKLVYRILRDKAATKEQILVAVALVELLTIELYNLRLSNLGDERYHNFQGITYRGMAMKEEVIDGFRQISENPDLTRRHFAIPLGFLSSTTDRMEMEKFAKRDAGKIQMHWTIHIHGLDPKLLRRYLRKYPDSVVTSICAMPVAKISDLGEKEILLRGPLFHIVGMKKEAGGEQDVYHFEVVMLNANRDHGTELGSNSGEKARQRAFFLSSILASRYEILASLAAKYSQVESEEYRRLALQQLARLDVDDPPTSLYDENLAEQRSFARATWNGARRPSALPQTHAALRVEWQLAAEAGEWKSVEKILLHEYDWRKSEWFNYFGLWGIGSHPS